MGVAVCISTLLVDRFTSTLHANIRENVYIHFSSRLHYIMKQKLSPRTSLPNHQNSRRFFIKDEVCVIASVSARISSQKIQIIHDKGGSSDFFLSSNATSRCRVEKAITQRLNDSTYFASIPGIWTYPATV